MAKVKVKKREPTVSDALSAYKKTANSLPNPLGPEDLERATSVIKNLARIAKMVDTADARESIAIASLGKKQLEPRILYNKGCQVGLYMDSEGLFVRSGKNIGMITAQTKHRSFLYEEFAHELPFWNEEELPEKALESAVSTVNSTIMSQIKAAHDKLNGGKKNDSKAKTAA